MTTIERKTFTQLFEIERAQILTNFSLAQPNLFMAGYLLTGSSSNNVHVEAVLMWAKEFQHYLSPIYTHKENCIDKIPIHYQNTNYYVDPISRQTFSLATEVTCDGNVASINTLDPDGNDF